MKAMILAAGRGERLRPMTDRLPKPLLKVAGKPLIVWLVERLVGSGITELVVNVSHLGTLIERTLGDGAAFKARIAYSREVEALETAGGIAAALPLLGDAAFLVVNGDVHTEFDFARLVPRAAKLGTEGLLAHLVLVDNPPHHPDGDFTLQDGFIASQGQRRLTFSGIGVYHPGLFAPVAPGQKYQLARLLREPIAGHKVSGEHYGGTWIDVGTPERLAAVERLLGRN
ncbi:MAG: N-acetylmuramate alpha-1-phosphate uridylyltransferase MurU [Betaproteobacteria bacterium]